MKTSLSSRAGVKEEIRRRHNNGENNNNNNFKHICIMMKLKLTRDFIQLNERRLRRRRKNKEIQKRDGDFFVSKIKNLILKFWKELNVKKQQQQQKIFKFK